VAIGEACGAPGTGGGIETDGPVMGLFMKCSTASMAMPTKPNAAPPESKEPKPALRRMPPPIRPPNNLSGLNIFISSLLKPLPPLAQTGKTPEKQVADAIASSLFYPAAQRKFDLR
jgi:hypothetical protein